MDLSKMTDDQLLSIYQQEKTKRERGFITPQTAPDPTAARQEYAAAVKQLDDDSAAYKRALPMRDQLNRFHDLNVKTGTGGVIDSLPGIGAWVADATAGVPIIGKPGKSEMASIAGSMQVNDIPKGQGQVSNFERTLYALGQPGIGKIGPVNDNIITRKQAAFDQEGDRLAFRQAYVAANGHLKGADEAWDKYVGANPYTVTAADPAHPDGKIARNSKREDWRTYFGVGAEATGPSRADQARAKLGVDPSKYARPKPFKASNGFVVSE